MTVEITDGADEGTEAAAEATEAAAEAVEAAAEAVEATAEAVEAAAEGNGSNDDAEIDRWVELENRLTNIENGISELRMHQGVDYDTARRIAEEAAASVAIPVAAEIAEEVAEDIVEDDGEGGDDEELTIVPPEVAASPKRSLLSKIW